MIKQVELYKTNDGELHTTEAKGEAHVLAQVENHVGRILDGVMLSPKDALRVMDALAGDIDKVKALHNFLDQWLS